MTTPADRVPRPVEQPRRIGRYTLRHRLGGGRMGDVYLAEGDDRRQVAIKLIRFGADSDRRLRELFAREVENARKVAGYCIPRVLHTDSDADPEQSYIVTEYVDGPTLSEKVEQQDPLWGTELHDLAVAVAVALIAIHRAGVVHCDLNPANVLLSSSGPRVIDFGVAHIADATRRGAATGRMGTEAFMAPEQLRHNWKITSAADVYAWGCVVAYAGTGRHPFGSGTRDSILRKTSHRKPDLKGLSPELLPLVTEALHDNPMRRPSARELLSRLLAPSPEARRVTLARVLGPDRDPGEAERFLLDKHPADELPDRPARVRAQWWQRRVNATAAGLVAAAAVVVAFLMGRSVAEPRAAPDFRPTYLIGFQGPLSGEHEQSGRRSLEGVRAAVDVANRDPDLPFRLKLVDYDDQGSAELGTAAAARLIENPDVVAVVGPTFSGPAQATIRQYQDAGLVTISPSATARVLTTLRSDMFHRIVPPDSEQGSKAAQYIADALHADKVLIVVEDDGERPYSTGLADELVRQLEFNFRGRGDRTFTRIPADPETDDFGPLRDLHTYDVVYYAGYAAGFAELLKVLRAEEYDGDIMSGDGSNQKVLLDTATSENIEIDDVYLTCPCIDVVKKAETADAAYVKRVTEFRDAYTRIGGGDDIDFYTAEGYDVVNVLIEVMKLLHDDVTRASVADRFRDAQFRETFTYQGLTRTISFSASGDVNTRDVFLYQIRDGRQEFLGNIDDLT